jgi:hypothetical protein
MDEIKKCPFCGGEGIARCIPYGRQVTIPGLDDCWVSCSSCKVERPSASPSQVVHTKDEAIAVWNTRAEDKE